MARELPAMSKWIKGIGPIDRKQLFNWGDELVAYLRDLDVNATPRPSQPPLQSSGGGSTTVINQAITPGTANQILATNTGATNTEWRTLQGVADETDVTFGSGTVTVGLVNPVVVAKGGTGLSSFTAGDIPYYASGTALSKLAIGTGLQYLRTNAGATAPEWATLNLATISAAPNSASYVTLGTSSDLTSERVLTGTSNQVTITDNGAGSTVVLSLPQSIHTGASPTFAGLTLSGLTSGRVALIGASGVLADSANFVHDLANMTATSGTERALDVSKSISLTGTPSSTLQGMRLAINYGNSAAYSTTTAAVLQANANYTGSGSLGAVIGLSTITQNTGSGTITTAHGAFISTATNSGGGHITNFNGIQIFDPVAFSANNQTRYGLSIRSMPDPGAFTGCQSKGIFFVGTGQYNSISWNNHSTIYSDGSDSIYTPDSFNVGATFRHTGSSLGFYNATPVSRTTGWSTTSHANRRTFDEDLVTLPQLAEAVGTIIQDLVSLGLFGA